MRGRRGAQHDARELTTHGEVRCRRLRPDPDACFRRLGSDSWAYTNIKSSTTKTRKLLKTGRSTWLCDLLKSSRPTTFNLE